MANEFQYVDAYKSESHGRFGSTGVKIGISISRKLTDADKRAIWKAAEMIGKQLATESIRLDLADTTARNQEKADILALFDAPIYAEEIPNEYDVDSLRPWFRVTTNVGHIKIGWRRHVICISWNGTKVRESAMSLFPNENVTRDNTTIHAENYEDAKRYIRTLLTWSPDR